MTALASIFRFLQLFAHAAHNMTKGCTFMQDHAFFGELYAAYEEAFDDLVERQIGLGKLTDIQERFDIDLKAVNILKNTQGEDLTDCDGFYEILLEMEQEVCAKIEKLASGKISQGTMNLLAQLADDSEKRQYKIGQRLGDDDAAEGETSEDDGDEIKRAY